MGMTADVFRVCCSVSDPCPVHRNAQHQGVTPKMRKPTKAEEKAAYEAVTTRDGGKCVRCGWYGGTQRDHRQNRSQGGATTVENLQLLCLPCHTWKGANPSAAVLEGFAVPGWARPELWPAWRYDVHSWVLYERDGWTRITETVADLLMHGEVD